MNHLTDQKIATTNCDFTFGGIQSTYTGLLPDSNPKAAAKYFLSCKIPDKDEARTFTGNVERDSLLETVRGITEYLKENGITINWIDESTQTLLQTTNISLPESWIVFNIFGFKSKEPRYVLNFSPSDDLERGFLPFTHSDRFDKSGAMLHHQGSRESLTDTTINTARSYWIRSRDQLDSDDD